MKWMNSCFKLVFLLCFCGVCHVLCAGTRVVELSDRFLELRGDSTWLIMFYAPWCGHCRKLEPTWGHIAQALYGTQIRVGRVDATRFTAFAAEFEVRGFPTIIFLRGSERAVYQGDRTTADIVGFARRMLGPPLPHVTELPNLPFMPTATTGREKEEGGIFVYAGPKDGELWSVYSWLADEHRYYHYFYTMDEEHLDKLVGRPLTYPAVVVHKDGSNSLYPGPEGEGVNASLSRWVLHERFPHFMRFTGSSLAQVFKGSKNIAMVVVGESKTGLLTTDETAFRDMLQTIAREDRNKYHQHFQFGWTGTPHLANNLVMTRLPLPSLVVINTTTLVCYVPPEPSHDLNHDLTRLFLDAVLEGTAEGRGGDSYAHRVQRAVLGAAWSLQEMWQGNPVLTTLLFGLPMGFLSLILYSVCCGDIMDAPMDEDDEGEGVEEYERRLARDMDHEKKD
ncbi:protein disulfide-isomerase TMX3 isoform X2 [Hyalella azteca]|uniref:Protein disulfide-isomerase TMX3 isoform X2 n=1 Tax=Hyalella azteca TaxID=294128 RepID=A0A8B7PIS2_HYAAZ|nr:protein disulfide-isomerase TMX3 isoform X2 [Hyalella azteca]